MEGFEVFLSIGTLLLVFGLALPAILRPVYGPWLAFAALLSLVMTRVILGLLFYAVLTPIGLVSRLFGKHFLELGPNTTKKTHWNYKTTKIQHDKDYEKQF